MDKQKMKRANLSKRKRRVRAKVFGSPERPRLCVRRSNSNIYAMLIDDTTATTLCSASTIEQDFRKSHKRGSDKQVASLVGKSIAERALKKGYKTVTFDRGGRIYHGRVRALAEAAREAGLTF